MVKCTNGIEMVRLFKRWCLNNYKVAKLVNSKESFFRLVAGVVQW